MSEQVSRDQAAISATEQTAPGATAPLSMHGLRVTVIRIAIIGGFLLLWEIASGRWIRSEERRVGKECRL